MTNSVDDDDQTLTNFGRIEAKVAAVISGREVAINRGAADFVKEGMRFAILGYSDEIADPDDPSKSLGRAEIIKSVMKVVRITGSHLSILRTFRTIPGNPGVFSAPLISSLGARPDHVETIKLDPSVTPLADQDEAFRVIAVGDKAVETRGDEYDVLG